MRGFDRARLGRARLVPVAEKVAADPFLRELVLRDMEREWKQLHARYGHFQEFISLVAETVAVAA